MGPLFSINQFIWHFIAFILFAWVIYKVGWKPILGMIDARKDAIDKSFKDIEDKEALLSRLQSEYEAKIREIQDETTRRIQDAIRQGTEIAAEIKRDAEAQREKLLEKAHSDILREREIASAELRNQVVELSFAISERLLKDPTVLNERAHKILLEKYLSEMEGVR